MANWRGLEEQATEMAAVARGLLARHQVAYVATVRRDGGPRVHHVCPAIVGEWVYLSIGARSPKLEDLRRDGRYMLHLMCGEEDAEFNFRGSSTEVVDAAEQGAVRAGAAAQGLRFTEEEVLFRLDVERADSTRWENFGTPEIRPVRSRWVAVI